MGPVFTSRRRRNLYQKHYIDDQFSRNLSRKYAKHTSTVYFFLFTNFLQYKLNINID